MSFNGYYLKIDGTAYPTQYMVISSYALDDAPIVVSEYYDAEYGKHIVKAPKNDITITFNIRSLFSNEYPSAIAPFSDSMTIEYYDPKTNSYKTDTFTYEGSLTPSVLRQYNSTLLYNELTVKLVRKEA